MAAEQLTYTQIAERLGASVDAARAVVKQHRLPRSRGTGGKTLVSIDFAEIQDQQLPAPRGAPADDETAALKARIEQLENELAANRADFERERRRIGQLETELADERQRSASCRADFERERQSADQLAAEAARARTWPWWWPWAFRWAT